MIKSRYIGQCDICSELLTMYSSIHKNTLVVLVKSFNEMSLACQVQGWTVKPDGKCVCPECKGKEA